MRNLRKHFAILIAYTLVTLVMTYPLVANLATSIPGVAGDATSFVWAMGWMKTALERGINPFRSDFVFYPLGGATQLLWATSLIASVSIPVQSVFGLIVTHNLFYLAATVMTAYGTYLLAADILRNSKAQISKLKFDATPLPPFQTLLLVKFVTEQRRLAARVSPIACFIAGLVFAFAPLRLGYGLAFFNLFHTALIPFYVLFLLRALRTQARRDGVLAGVLLGLNAYIDFQLAAFLILFTGLFAAYDWFQRFRTQDNSSSLFARIFASFRMTILPVVMIGILSLLIAAPMLVLVAGDFAAEGGNYIRVFPLKYSAERSYDLLAYVLPNARSTLYASIPKIPGINAGVHADDLSALSPDRQAFVGYLVLVLAICAMITQWRRVRFWSIAVLVFAVLGLGPSLNIGGQTTNLPLPYVILHAIPIVNHIRIPMRYGIMMMFAMAILTAFAVNELIRRRALRLAILLLPIFILLEFAILPYPLQPVSIPRIYAMIAQQPGDFTVLEIPSFYWRFAAATEVYQAIHGKRILRAYTNRIAPDLAEYAGTRGIPIVARSLRILEGLEPGPLLGAEIEEDKRARDAVVRFYDLRYAIVHRSDLKPAQVTAIDNYLREVLKAHVIAEEGEAVAYEIPRAGQMPTRTVIDLRELIGQMYVGRGWWFRDPPANFDARFNFVYARGAKSEIYFVADDARERTLTINAFADPPQSVGVFLNDARVGAIDLNDVWQDYRVALPADTLRTGMNRIELWYGAELSETIGVTTIVIE